MKHEELKGTCRKLRNNLRCNFKSSPHLQLKVLVFKQEQTAVNRVLQSYFSLKNELTDWFQDQLMLGL